jgi:putative ABC transport system substrate-binding protein
MRLFICAVSLVIGWVASAAALAADKATRVPRIGILLLEPRSPGDLAEINIRALNALGYGEGTAVFDVRSAEWSHVRLRQLASELAASNVDVIVAHTNLPGFAAKEATKLVPIVVMGAHAAVETGLVASLARPGGNVTGVENLAPELDAKRLQLLREIAPRLTRLGVVYNSADPGAPFHLRAASDAARALQFEVVALPVSQLADFDKVLDAGGSLRLDGVLTFTDRLTASNWAKIGAFSLKHRVPTVCEFRFLAQAGCLISYGPLVAEITGRVAAQVDRILKGAKPAEVPMDRVTRFELVVNMKTAKAIGVAIPNSIRTRADDVIE